MAYQDRATLCLLLIFSVAHGQFTVSSTSDSGEGSLRAAIASANAGAVINFDTALFSSLQTITLTNVLAITKSDITINGPGADLVTISGGSVSKVFFIDTGITNIVMTGLSVRLGSSSLNDGGCIRNLGQLRLTGCIISQCETALGNGGGISNEGTLVVDECTISSNTALLGGGGAICSSFGTSLTISRSTFTANTATNGGAGDALNLGAMATITDSTFTNNGFLGSGNSAITIIGGTSSIQGCTITANFGDFSFPGGLGVFAGTVTIENSIIYGNLGSGVDVLFSDGIIADNGYNIIGTFSGFAPVSPDLGDPLLGPLANNGGPTMTHALGTGSPAINAANPAVMGTTDQRGLLQAGWRDIGAYELQFAELEITKTARHSLPAGIQLTYTITITNHGPSDAENVVLTDTLPVGVTLDSVDAVPGMQFSMSHFVVTGVQEFLAALTSITIHVTVTVPSTFAGTTIINTACVASDTYDANLSNNQDTAPTEVVSIGTGGGDPSFVGFMGQKFGFSGKANKSFHIFSDPYITINSRFAVANPSKGKGTVMYAFGIRWENHTVTFGVDSLIKNNGGGNKDASLLISIDSIDNTLPRSNQPTQLDDCINATWSFSKLRINTPIHRIVIDWRSEHNDHINGSYLNIRIDAPLNNPTLCGGVLGQTASPKNAKSLSKKDSDFITSDDMISIEAKTSKFIARPMLCAAVATLPQSTAEAAHEHDYTTDVEVAHGMRI